MSSDRFFVHHLKDGNIFELWRIRANNAGLLTTEFFHASPNAEWLDDHRSTDWKKPEL